ncbi:MAG: hypothetical protein B6241_15090 [Spirochaetaceae bacterium 4572_59]|nr:MAG: hypothetical protein B6241_15090 [Spirochaetaceae bacterium 4572_59]
MFNYFFVYGTLKKGCRNHHFLSQHGIESCGAAYTRGKLYHLINENYPAMLPGTDLISGELYKVDSAEEISHILDKLENYNEENEIESEYIRKKISVSDEAEYDISAYAYCYNIREIDDFKNNSIYLPAGEWKEIQAFVK